LPTAALQEERLAEQ